MFDADGRRRPSLAGTGPAAAAAAARPAGIRDLGAPAADRRLDGSSSPTTRGLTIRGQLARGSTRISPPPGARRASQMMVARMCSAVVPISRAWRRNPRRSRTVPEWTCRPAIRPAVGRDTDGDDYIEGNGGSDLVFGGLGQDDIIGGNSNLFSLGGDHGSALRPDAADLLFGGSGDNIARNDAGVTGPDQHARDADAI